MKRLLLSLGIFLSIGYGISQTSDIGDYAPVFSEDNIVLSIAEGTFKESNKNHVRYFLKYENNSNDPVKLSFNKELHYGDNCYGCDDKEEQFYSVTIPANTTLMFNDDNRSKSFYIFVKDKDGWIKRQLTKFEIKNIKITQL